MMTVDTLFNQLRSLLRRVQTSWIGFFDLLDVMEELNPLPTRLLLYENNNFQHYILALQLTSSFGIQKKSSSVVTLRM